MVENAVFLQFLPIGRNNVKAVRNLNTYMPFFPPITSNLFSRYYNPSKDRYRLPSLDRFLSFYS